MNELHFRFMELSEKSEEDLYGVLFSEYCSGLTPGVIETTERKPVAGGGCELFDRIFSMLSEIVYSEFHRVKENVDYPIDLFPIIFPLTSRLEYLNPLAKLTVAVLVCKRLLDEKYLT